jgi:hypothetical protein
VQRPIRRIARLKRRRPANPRRSRQENAALQKRDLTFVKNLSCWGVSSETVKLLLAIPLNNRP